MIDMSKKEQESSTSESRKDAYESKRDTYEPSKEKQIMQFVYSDGGVAAEFDKNLPAHEQARQVLTALFAGFPDRYIERALGETLLIPSASDYVTKIDNIRGMIKNISHIVGMETMIAVVRDCWPKIFENLSEPTMEYSSGKHATSFNSTEVISWEIKAEYETTLKQARKTTYRIRGSGSIEFVTKAPTNNIKKFSVEENDLLIDSNLRVTLLWQTRKLQHYGYMSPSYSATQPYGNVSPSSSGMTGEVNP